MWSPFTVLRDRAHATETFDKLIRFYRKQGVAQVGIEKMSFSLPRPLAMPVFATVQAEWRLWTREGLPLLGFHTTQILRRTKAGWRVSSTANHDEIQRFASRSRG